MGKKNKPWTKPKRAKERKKGSYKRWGRKLLAGKA